MDAIKKKMQAMKVEKDNAMDRADACEQVTFSRTYVISSKNSNNRSHPWGWSKGLS